MPALLASKETVNAFAPCSKPGTLRLLKLCYFVRGYNGATSSLLLHPSSVDVSRSSVRRSQSLRGRPNKCPSSCRASTIRGLSSSPLLSPDFVDGVCEGSVGELEGGRPIHYLHTSYDPRESELQEIISLKSSCVELSAKSREDSTALNYS